MIVLAALVFLNTQTLDLRIKTADSLFEYGRYEAAESLYRVMSREAGELLRAGAEKGLGNIAFVNGRYAEAERSYRAAHDLYRKAGDQAGEARTLIDLGNLSYLQNDHAAARQSYEKAIAIIRGRMKSGVGELKDLIGAEANLGQIDMAAGDLDQARIRFRDALQMSRSIADPIGEADNLQNIGNLFQSTGEPDSALECYDEAVKIFQKVGYAKRAADVLREAGSIYRKLGEFEPAYERTYRALGFIKLIKKTDYLPGEGELFNNLGLLFQDLGNYRSALDNYRNGLKAFRFLGDSVGVKKIETNMGNAYLRLAAGDSIFYDSCRFFYESARKIGNRPVDQADYYNNLGALEELRGQYRAAAENYIQAEKIYKKIDDHLGLARTANNLANIAMIQGDYSSAVQKYRAALLQIQSFRRRDWEASLQANLGIAQRQSGDIDNALLSLKKAAEITEQIRQGIGSQEFRSQYFENKISIFEELAALYVQKGMPAEAFRTAERAKARAFLDLLSGAGGIGLRPEMDAGVKALIAKESELEKKIEYLTGDTAQPRTIIEHDSVLKVLVAAYPDYQALKSASPISVEDLQSNLDDRTAVVEYFLGGRTGFVFVVTRDRLTVKQLDAAPLAVYESVDSMRKAIRVKKDFTRYGRELYGLLLAPVRPDIGGAERLCVIPHSALHHLPFAALVVNEAPRRLLIDDFDLFYAPSASVYALAREKDRRRMTRSAIFAKSDFAEHPEWFDMPLPGTNAEKESLLAARVMPGVAVFSDVGGGMPPSETNAKRYAADFDILHFATHGKLDPESPLDSRIMLTADSAEDGNLRVREIFGLKLNAYLVTLSACQTGQLKGFSGMGRYALGDELTGLSRAFIYAGAPSVVASLWKVSDAATVMLMVNFYKNLKTRNKTAALCAAQRTLMKSEYYGEPFYWAPFVVIGDGD